MKFINYKSLLALLVVVNHQLAFAHAEHDKARYVAFDGIDQGRCDNPKKPCKNIRYAAQNANKGDQIRLAQGSYLVEDAETLFYLMSDMVPIKANYSQRDHFDTQNAKYKTTLIGVPKDYRQTLTDRGFHVIVDGKTRRTNADIEAQMSSYQRLQQAKSNIDCIGKMAGDHECSQLDLVGHLPLNAFSTNPREANDIWGYIDLNSFREYAIIGLNNGIGIVDVTSPSAPVVIDTIASNDTIWRDIKVYQRYNFTLHQWQSYAYITADDSDVGLLILDLTNLPNRVVVAAQDKTDLSAHNVYLSNVDYSTGVALTNKKPYLHIAGSSTNGGGFNSYRLDQPTNPVSVYQPPINQKNYTHDASSMVITDERKDSQCVNGTDHCEVMFDFNESDFHLWDKTLNEQPEKLSTTTYPNSSYVHSGWYTEDKMLMLVHDELDEQEYGLNTTLRLFDITDLTSPMLLSTWTGDTRAIDHNGYVRGNRYYMSNYERGITVIDLSVPTAPREVGFFDTYPISNNPSFNGAWGVYPFLPSGYILASDVNSGLYILKDNTLLVEQGSFRFNKAKYSTDEGENLTIYVERIHQASDSVSVHWELVTGSANSDDFNLSSGTLHWQDNEHGSKAINIKVLDDLLAENQEVFFVRLFDPKNGATLSAPNLATIAINASTGNTPPEINLGQNFTIEANQTATLSANVVGVTNAPLTYSWRQISGEQVTLTNANQLIATFTAPANAQKLIFEFTTTDNTGLSNKDSIVVDVTIPSPKAVPIMTAKSDARGGSVAYLLALLILIFTFTNKVLFIKQANEHKKLKKQ
ncbi:choice-of-anchor B family protein [Thalassotalea aquiviva]|uniref:choice-of-anchor B family protein n=1 Tax=Thalassotalea aquiviva TaxID=3242415 RepID=UPI00352B429A